MDHATQYRLNEQKHRERLEELKCSEYINDISDEIAIVRAMIEDSINNKGNAALTRDLVSLLSSLVKVNRQHAVDDNNLLARDALGTFAAATVEIIADELSKVTGWEEIADKISGRVMAALDGLSNQPSTGNGVETNGRKTRFKN